MCIDEISGNKRLREESISKDVRPLSIDPVGRYAIRFHWSDGHSTGIYTFEHLRELCPCPICADNAEARAVPRQAKRWRAGDWARGSAHAWACAVSSGPWLAGTGWPGPR